MPLDTKFIRGADKLQRRIQTIRANLGLPAMVDEIGKLLLRRTLERFDQGVDPDGNRWPALKDQTIDRKRRGGYPELPLKRTLALRNSIKLIKGDVTGTTFTNTGAGVRIGVEDPKIAEYAVVQNRGDARKHIPARRFLGIGQLDIKSVDSFLRRKAETIMGSL